MSDERKVLTREQAIGLLPKGDDIHTFMDTRFGALIGADWLRDQVIEDIDKHGAELSGPTATSMGHGMVLSGTRTFIATDKDAISAIRKELGED